MTGLFKTSVARKVAMTLSTLFLILFLIVHLVVNLISVISENTFNELSYFMGTSPLIQFAMQPVLLAGVIFHFVMEFVLEIQNERARGSEKYYVYNGGANSFWMSHNMIIIGMMILLFLGLHLWDFRVGEMSCKYIQFSEPNPTRYYHELIEEFHEPLRASMHVLYFVFLCLRLLHGFQSTFQSMGWEDDARKKLISRVGNWYSYVICGGFIFIALFHYVKFLTA